MSDLIYSLCDVADLSDWLLEGDGQASLRADKVLRLSTIDTGLEWPKTPPCCTLWYKHRLPEDYRIEYDFSLVDGKGASIVFIDAQGVVDEDVFSWSRSGGWEGYADLGLMRMYTMSFGRIDSPGCNMRKLWAPTGDEITSPIVSANPVDLCTEVGKLYRHRIEKTSNHVVMTIDGEVAHEYRDDGTFGPSLHGGWFAIRNFRYARTSQWQNLVITAG